MDKITIPDTPYNRGPLTRKYIGEQLKPDTKNPFGITRKVLCTLPGKAGLGLYFDVDFPSKEKPA